jgi:hypothetical protein
MVGVQVVNACRKQTDLEHDKCILMVNHVAVFTLFWPSQTSVKLGLRPFSIAVAFPARVERPILITWKISRTGTPRKLNVVLLSWHVCEQPGRQKMHKLRQLQRKLSDVRSTCAGKATAMENGL